MSMSKVFGCTSALLCSLIAAAGCGGQADRGQLAGRSAALSTPGFVQINADTPQGSISTVTVPFTAAQTAGNLNVVVVGWSDTAATVSSVNDTKGNAYQVAVPMTSWSGGLRQSIYYAKNIVAAAAGANSVTVVFSRGARAPDVRVVEYSGIDPVNPVDVTATGTGSGGTSSTSAVTTTSASDLLFAANTVEQTTKAAGTGFTKRIITTPDGDLVEDRTVTVTGSYSATASLVPGGYVMQMVAFRAAGGSADTQPPTAPSGLTATAVSGTQINLSWTASTDDVGVTSYLVESCAGPGCGSFAQIGSTAGTTFNNTGLTNATSYSYRVRATDAAGNLSAYSSTATTSTPDTQAPTAPPGLAAAAVSTSQINLTWTGSTDNVGVTAYLLERCSGATCSNFAQISANATSPFGDTGLSANTPYSYRVRATDAAGNLSGYSNTASATTPATADTQPPTAPSGLAANAISSSQINLSWTASTDDVGVTGYLVESCAGAGCGSFAQIGTTAGTTFNTAGLAGSTSYSYRVRATDAAGNLSGYSNTATTSTPAPPDTQPPTAPSGLLATAVSTSQINLTWTASTDNVGVTAYLLERCAGASCSSFAQISGNATSPYGDTGLNASTSYSYRIRATDAAGNLSGYSNTASATTQTPPDTQPPTAPSGPTATAVSSSQVNLSWTASTDNVGVTSYLVESCSGAGCSNFAQIGSPAGTAFSNTGLTASTAYSYRVRATDAAGNLSGYSGTASATTQAVSTAPTYVQGNYSCPQSPQTSVPIAFTSAQNAGDLIVVIVGWNDSTAQVSSVTDSKGNSYVRAVGPTVVSGALSQSIYYAAGIAAAPANGNTVTVAFSPAAAYPDIRILEYGGIVPASPVDVASAATGNGTASSTAPVPTSNANDLLVMGNTVTSETSTAGTGFTRRLLTSPDGDIAEDRVVTATGSYSASANLSYPGSWIAQMVAFRAGGGTPDTQPPTAPSGLTATAVSGNQINLAWTAATDNVGVTNYLVESCSGAGCSSFAQIGTSASTSFNNTGLAAATSYSYRVRATDAAGNLGPYSGTASATTLAPDTQPPTAPSSLSANATSGARVDLAWTASTDNVGVSAYLVERCQGSGCSGFAQIGTSGTTAYADTTVAGNTTYSYRVRASDAAGNLSGYSNTASATTPAQSTPPPAFVQGTYATPQSPQTSVPVPFTSAQTAGDLNVVVVGWNDANSHTVTVTDSKGNAYTRAVGPTVHGSGVSQSMYYASNIAAGANTVTVVFSPAAAFPDVRILEYSGILAANVVDAVNGSSGNSALSSSGFITTTNPVDLLVAANTVTTATSGPGTGFTKRMITAPDGDIVEDLVVTQAGTFSASAGVGTGGWVMQIVAFKSGATPAPPDSTPPTVSITSPLPGASLNGTTTVTVTASDAGSGVIAVQLMVDGSAVGQPDTSSPYTFSLDTSKFANGAHTLSAVALDGSRNQGVAADVPVTFSNASPGNPAATGLWSGTTPVPIVSVHQVLLPNGRILMSDGQSFGPDAQVWDYRTNGFTSAPVPANVFCSAAEQMSDGRILVVGGHNNAAHAGLSVVNVFDPVTQSWAVLPDMAYPRWYPTVTMLPTGRLLVLAGETTCNGCNVLIPEIYDPIANSWSKLNSASFNFTYYPHVYVLPDGRVLVAGTSEEPTASQILNVNLQTWTAVGGPAVDGGSSVMYRPWKFLKTGTSIDPDEPSINSARTAYVLDLTQGTPNWRQIASMGFARTFHTLTSLPDGNVLVTGGGPTTAATDTAHAIRAAELWNPDNESWTTLSSMNAPRLYHSAALLLPDGRVAILGGGRFDDITTSTDQFNAEFFSPPYLFKGPRPAISSAPATLQYNQPFTVQTPDAARIGSVVLIRYGAVTHAINMGQRYLPLTFTPGSSSLTVTAPVDANLAPPGNYMLFIVDTNGVPSVASTVHF
jgi:chitodextrinase